MHILLTGAAGRVGSHTLTYLIARGHTVTATDLVPLPQTVLDSLPKGVTTHICDLTDYKAFESLLKSCDPPIEGVIHLGAIPDPLSHDARVVHNNNVISSYNVLRTVSDYGVKRIVQASSVNAIGLGYAEEAHWHYDTLPFDEEYPIRPEDPYSISKAICELQGTAMTRFNRSLRIASLRFHWCCSNYEYTIGRTGWREMWAWTSFDAAASACLLGLTSEGWSGHEAFNIVAPEIAWEYGVRPEDKGGERRSDVSTIELLEYSWKGKYDGLRREYWEGRPRRSIWDSSKAERMLGWDHDKAGDM